ncbi:MAG TPA: hypothetical protein VJX67_23645 [Blastocatellia bacterium]|nr:hypothetical protein [Blastocatellia bacterium]
MPRTSAELPIIQRTYDLIPWYIPLLNRLPSWIAHLEHGDTWSLRERILGSHVFGRGPAGKGGGGNFR